MQKFTYTIQDALGIHARPAGMLVKEAKKYASKISITGENGKSADLTRLMSLMGLGIKAGNTVTIEAEGEDEEAAIKALQEMFEKNL